MRRPQQRNALTTLQTDDSSTMTTATGASVCSWSFGIQYRRRLLPTCKYQVILFDCLCQPSTYGLRAESLSCNALQASSNALQRGKICLSRRYRPASPVENQSTWVKQAIISHSRRLLHWSPVYGLPDVTFATCCTSHVD